VILEQERIFFGLSSPCVPSLNPVGSDETVVHLNGKIQVHGRHYRLLLN
jgi:hypothetical protein